MPDNDDTPQPRQLTDQQQWVETICSVAGWDYRIMAGRAAKLGKQLRGAGGTVGDVLAYYGQSDSGAVWWWYRDDWRGKRGERPADYSMRETWGRWELPVAVAQPGSAVGSLFEYAMELRRGDSQ